MPLVSRSSFLIYAGTADALPCAGGAGPKSHIHHLPAPSSDELLSRPFPFFLRDFERERVFSVDLSLPCESASGGSMNDTRLGVLRPEPPTPKASDTLSQLLLTDSAGEMGVGGAERPLRPFIADTRGGLGGRVDDV